jgi:glycerophosphoryl diester phosphodiesterase
MTHHVKVSRGRLIVAVAAVCAVTIGWFHLPATAGSTTRPSSSATAIKPSAKPILVIAHRGFSRVAPENTIPAMKAAVAAKADMVEIDVQRTRDRQLVVLHDKTLLRTTNVAKVFPSRSGDQVGTFTLAEIQRLDAGSWKGSRYAGTRVPTLDQLLAYLAPTHAGLLLELKNPSFYPGIEKQVAQALSRHGFDTGRAYVHSFSASALRTFHQFDPTVPIGLITKTGLAGASSDEWAQMVNPSYGTVTDAGVDAAQADHEEVFAWPKDRAQDTPREIKRLVDDGVNGVITNSPDTARRLSAMGTGTTAPQA